MHVLSSTETLVTEEFLVARIFSYYRKGSSPSGLFRFLPDGRVGIYNSINERTWRIENGVVCVINDRGVVTTRFDKLEREQNSIILSGIHIPNPNIILCLREQVEAWPKREGTKSSLAQLILAHGWNIGDHTYGTPDIIEPSGANLTIGKYTSISGGVRICLANHRMDTISTYPFTTLHTYWPSAPKDVPDHHSKGDVLIGNDVWIGFDAFIGSGVAIGDGAVIGAKSVVTKDVPPYAIVAGNPAKIVRYRFDKETISRLLTICWWAWPEEIIDAQLPLMMSGKIDEFISTSMQLTSKRMDEIRAMAPRPGTLFRP